MERTLERRVIVRTCGSRSLVATLPACSSTFGTHPVIVVQEKFTRVAGGDLP